MELIRMPQAGWTMKSASIVQWHKRERESVARGEPLLELETDKANVEVESPASGVVLRVLVQAGKDVEVGTPLAVIAREGEEVDAAAVDEFVKVQAGATADSLTPGSGSTTLASDRSKAPASAAVRAAPRVRKLAADLGVDLATVAHTGPGETIVEADVLKHAKSVGGVPKLRSKVPLAGIRKSMAIHMVQSWQTIPHFHQIVEVDAERLLQKREEESVTLTTLFVHAAALALPEHPWINATFDGKEVSQYEDVNIGVAIETDKGLVVPVIRNANKQTLKELATELEKLSIRARAGELSPDDLANGTFTVSNLGMFGIETGTPIINAPQVALMFVGSVQRVPALRAGALVEVPRVKVTFSYDHRVVDGVTAARFSQHVRQLLESGEASPAARAS